MSSVRASPGPEPLIPHPHVHVTPREGESAPFHFTSQWAFGRPAAEVWDVFADLARWPEWWPGVREVSVRDPGDDGGEGTRAVLCVARPVLSDLRLDLRVRQTDPPHEAFVEVDGDLRGHGHWHAVDDASADGSSTAGRGAAAHCRIEFVWCVVTRSLPTRLLRGAAGAAHRRVMDAGCEGLRERLGTSAAG